MRSICLIISLTLLGFGAKSQRTASQETASLETASQRIAELEAIAEKITSYRLEENRVELNRAFTDGLSSLMRDTNVFDLPLLGLQKYISIVSSADLRIYSWQIKHDEDTYEYFGLVQRKKDPQSPIRLDDVSDELTITDMIELRRADWFGCYYYNMIPHTTEEGEQVYILFGYDSNDQFSNKKIIDVLYLDSLGEVTFGYPVFYHDDGPRYRRVFDIDESSTSRINFDPAMDIIIFNHFIAGGGEGRQESGLTSKSVQYYQVHNGKAKIGEIDGSKEIPRPQEGRILLRPDGSYQGYRLIDGRWTFIDKVFNQVLNEAPRPKPVFKVGQ